MKRRASFRMRQISIIVLLLIIAAFPLECKADNHTILMYVLGCDLESDSGSATNDLMEITKATKETQIKVIAYLGGCTTWWMPELEDSHCYVIEIERGEKKILSDYGEQISSEAEQFGNFLTKYGHDGDDLILWGHGLPGGRGIGTDSLADNNSLTLSEIQTGLKKSGLKLRLVGFDACQMATLEAAWIVLPYAEYFAALPEEETLSGWNYRNVLPVLNHPEVNAPEKLRDIAIGSGRNNVQREALTVFHLSDCEKHMSSLIRVLDTAPLASDPVVLNELAETCQDREAGEAILTLLDDQRLHISVTEERDELVLPGIQEAYISFINRK